MTDRIVSAGDTVKVFDVNGHRDGQPEDGWDGVVLKVGSKLAHIRYGRFNEVRTFRLDTQVTNDRYEHQMFRTLAQADERRCRRAAMATLNANGLEANWKGQRLPLEVLEQLAAVLTAYDESKDGAS